MKKRHKIVMLPSEKPGSSTMISIYILSNEDPQNGDWCVINGIGVRMFDGAEFSSQKKIIATTDLELIKPGVAPIPQHIIEAYAEEPFDEVEVEYYEFLYTDKVEARTIFKPKRNQDGTLAVSLVEEKMYSKQDFIDSLHKYWNSIHGSGYTNSKMIKWIKENL